MQLHGLRDRLRPATLDEVVGNTAAKKFLRGMIESQRYEHLLFHGPIGTGKSTLAEIVRKECVDPYWRSFLAPRLNASHYSGVDFVRGLLTYSDILGLKPFVLDEAHALSKQAQTALLSVMEDPNANILFFFCTTEIEKLLPALRRRCRKIRLQPLVPAERVELIARAWRTIKGDEPLPQEFVDNVQATGLDSGALILNALDDFVTGATAKQAVVDNQPETYILPCASTKTGTWRARRSKIIFTDAEVQRAAEMYRAGDSWEQIKKAFGLRHSHKLRTAMREAGIFKEKRLSVKRVNCAQIVELYKSGLPVKEIAAKCNCSTFSVWRIAKKEGLHREKKAPLARVPRKRKVDPMRALEMRKRGMSYAKIGAHFGATGPAAIFAVRRAQRRVPK